MDRPVGRDHELRTVHGLVERTLRRHGGVALITGEAGIGKTVLLTDVVAYARDAGPLVLVGTSGHDDEEPVLWPWTQVLRDLQRALPSRQWAEFTHTEGSVAPVIDDLLERYGGPEAATDFDLHDRVTRLLVAVSRSRPLVVVLDNLHLADPRSLRLLTFVARHTWFERILLLGAYRDVGLPRHGVVPEIKRLIGGLTSSATTLPLAGLDREGTARIVQRLTVRQPGPDELAELHRRTGGNPLFVEQLARLRQFGHPPDMIPQKVEDAVQARIHQLAAELRALLGAASVLGHRFDGHTLATVTGQPDQEVADGLTEAARLRLVESSRDGGWSFTHGLIRESLYAALSQATRRRTHAAVVDLADHGLIRTGSDEDLARHAWHAGDHIAPERAVEVMLEAARSARNARETRHAARLFERAGALCAGRLRARGVIIRSELAELLYSGGDRHAAWKLHEACMTEAEELDDVLLCVRVALGMPRSDQRYSERVSDLLRRLRPRLDAETGSGPFSVEHPDATVVGEVTLRAAVLARARGDDEAVGFVLSELHDDLWGLGTAAQREQLVEEIITVAHRTADPHLELFARALLWVALLEQGDLRFRDRLDTFARRAEESGILEWEVSADLDRGQHALFEGRFDDALEHADRADRRQSEQAVSEITAVLGAHLRWSVHRMRGRTEASVRPSASRDQDWPSDVIIGLTALEEGDLDTAERCHRAVSARGAVPALWRSMWLRFQTAYAVAVDDSELATVVRTELGPHNGRWLLSLYGADVGGPVDYWIAVLDLHAGDTAEAERGFAAAARSARRLGAVVWEAWARTGERDARHRGAARAAPAPNLTSGSGGTRTAGQLTAPVTGPVAEPLPELSRDGSVWTVAFDGVSVLLPDSKGLLDLQTLVNAPGRDTAATELLDPSGGREAREAAHTGGDVVLDERARTEFRARLLDLDERIEQALSAGRDSDAAQLDTERATLVEHLRSATGLGGRSRRFGDAAERARKAVTARIRNAIRRIEAEHPDLGAHLRATVHTGARCVYLPHAAAAADRDRDP